MEDPKDYTIYLKSDVRSADLRNEGNKLFQEHKEFNAILKYNEALCYAESGEQRALAYGNRSAVYMELKLYKQCLHNIEMAKESGYPDAKMSTLNDREVRCKQQQMKEKNKRQENALDYFKLSYKANPKIPYIVDCLEVKTTEKYDRGIYTKHPLKVGDVISLEKPFFHVINTDTDKNGKESYKYNFCYNCLNDNILDLIPCSKCCSTMFCNEKCTSEAHKVHQYECKITDYYHKTGLQLVMQSFFHAYNIMDESIEDLQKLFIVCQESPKNIFDFNFSDPNNPENSKNELKAMLSLTHDGKFEEAVNLSKYSRKVVRHHLQAQGIWTPENGAFIMKLLRFLKSLYKSEIMVVRWPLNGLQVITPGIGKFLFGALINHSCDPNITLFQAEDKKGYIVIKPIGKGEQIFGDYQFCSFREMPIVQRKLRLKFFGIDCDCDACKYPNRYGTTLELKIKDMKMLHSIILLTLKIFNMNRKDSFETAQTLKMNCQTRYSPQTYPTREWMLTLGAFMTCMETLQRRDQWFKNF